MTNECTCKVLPGEKVLKQFVQKVLGFSSQYGSDNSHSYVASNLVGRPQQYPNHGDYPDTYTFRHYGPWLKAKNDLEFVDVQYDVKVYPSEIIIYETYNPGSLISIWGYDEVNFKWYLLSENKFIRENEHSRKCQIKLRNVDILFRIFRLIFNHTDSNYYVGLDAIEMVGSTELFKQASKESMFLNKVKSFEFEFINESTSLSHHYNKIRKWIEAEGQYANVSLSSPFPNLPGELILKIFKYLDLPSLINTACVSKKFNEIAKDGLLYQSLNLHNYWCLINNKLLCIVAKQGHYIKKLDLSWCGTYDKVNENQFISLITQCLINLEELQLNSCTFLTDEGLGIISCCSRLKVLCINNCEKLTDTGIQCIASLYVLNKLEVSRTRISTATVISVIKCMPKLKVLNIAGCVEISNLDQVLHELSINCQSLSRLDCWKTKGLTPEGLLNLARFKFIEYLDIGWSFSNIEGFSTSFHYMVQNLGESLKYLIMTACRITHDYDIIELANCCSKLEYLDIMGNCQLSASSIDILLSKCHNLKLLDVSYCPYLTTSQLAKWQESFKVNIKFYHDCI